MPAVELQHLTVVVDGRLEVPLFALCVAARQIKADEIVLARAGFANEGRAGFNPLIDAGRDLAETLLLFGRRFGGFLRLCGQSRHSRPQGKERHGQKGERTGSRAE